MADEFFEAKTERELRLVNILKIYGVEVLSNGDSRYTPSYQRKLHSLDVVKSELARVTAAINAAEAGKAAGYNKEMALWENGQGVYPSGWEYGYQDAIDRVRAEMEAKDGS